MVQGHPKKVNTCPGFWYSSHGCGFEGSICTGFGSESYMRFPGSSEYRTSYLGGYPYEQRCACQSEKFELCGFEKSGRETRGFMLNITGLNRFLFVNDGSYSIDNSIAERFIRPLIDERKNSSFFGSDKMARVLAIYHTIISACKMQGVSVLDYFKRFFGEIVKGRRDYEHLLPLTIGLD